MNGIDLLLQEPAAQAIGWALLHFVWQGTLVGALAAVALALLRRSDADVRYVVSAIGLALMATLPLVTAVQAYKAAAASQSVSVDAASPARPEFAVAGDPAPSVVAAPTPTSAEVVGGWSISSALASSRTVEPWIPVLVVAWLAGVAVLTLRLLSGWLWVQRLKSRGATVAARGLQVAVARLSKRLHISRPVRLLESSRVDVPTVVGWLKPVILLPVSALSGLSQAQVEAILAHELAHIRRHDYLVNLLQAMLETLLFYHPAVWWLSGRIRAERENCCDDMAVSLCGDPVAYARALADLEELRGTHGQLVVAASGGPLLLRVRRLLLPVPAAHDGRGPVWVAGATALLVVFTVGIAVVSHAQPADAQTNIDSGVASVQAQVPPAPPAPPTPPARPVTAPPAPPSTSVPLKSGVPPPPPASPAPPVVAAAGRLSEPPQPPAPARAPEPSMPSVPPTPPSVALPPPPAPAPPAVPAAPQGTRGNHISWSHNGEKIEIKWDGEFEISDDDTDIRTMTPGSQLRISDGGWLRGRSVEFSADGSGKITRRFWVGSSERPFEPEGKAWLTQVMPRFVRQSGLGAKGRVARIYKTGGVAGVLGEITLITGSWAKRLYFTELLALDITSDARRQALEQAGRELDSDYELASLLISQSDRFLSDAGTRKAYFGAARSIDSDYEMRRVFGSALKRGPLENELLAAMLDTSRSIDSDYELSSLLVQVVNQQSIESARTPFVTALGSIASPYERGRVLQALAERSDNSTETLAAMLASVSQSRSDYETAQFLVKFLKRPVDETLRVPLFRAIDGLGSDYERARVLKAVVGQSQLSAETTMAVITSARGMSGRYEASQLLQALAGRHEITGAARDAYIDVTQKLGDYEQGRALAALVKSDRAKK